MCTYLNGQLTAFTGEIPTNLITEPIFETDEDDGYDTRMASVWPDQDLVVNGSGEREKTAATCDQRDDRMQRNKHQRTLGRYEHITPASTYMWDGAQCTTEEIRETRKITKTSWARSAGKHGGKPHYKDLRSAHARI